MDFTWEGKDEAIKMSEIESIGTLKACKEESKDWDTTENLYIEGDNLEVLKLLQKSYFGKVKMIYIDPPYNTGKDFVYKDNFNDNLKNYMAATGQIYSEKNKLSANGKHHSDWLNMMYPRLKLARDLLKDDGVIFISIDDNEVYNLRKICDEIFGEQNFIASIVWERAYSPINLKKHFSKSHDYIISYANNIKQTINYGLKRSEESNNRYLNPDNDYRGKWKSSDLSVGFPIKEKIYEITTPTGRKVLPPDGYCWRLTKDRFQEYIDGKRIWFGQDENAVPSIKRFLSEVKQTITPMTIWKYEEVGHSQEAKQKLKKLFDGISVFDYPKPIGLIKKIFELYLNNDEIVLDFFSGSATTAESIFRYNFENKYNSKFILIQLPEKSENNDMFFTICEIGKERIKRAGELIKKEFLEVDEDSKEFTTDIGFKVFKLEQPKNR